MSTESEVIEQAYREQVAKLFDTLLDNEITDSGADTVALFLNGLHKLRETKRKALRAVAELPS